MLSAFERSLAQSRRRLARRERAAVSEIDATYRAAVRTFRADLAATQRAIATRRASGRDVSPGMLFQEVRGRELLDQAERAVRAISVTTETVVRGHGLAVIGEAQEDLRRQIIAAIGPGPEGVALPFATLPAEALTELSAALSPGSPLVDVIDGMAGAARRQVQDELTAGLARGESPREIGRNLQKIMGGTRARAELIATEAIFGAHRRATSESFKTNKKLLAGWTWSAALDQRCCVICYAKHGTEHPVEEELHSHTRCRCRQRPKTKSWADLGFSGVSEPPPEPLRLRRTGVDVFRGLDTAEQRRILGPGALKAYQAGTVDLPDFVQRTRHPVWGPGLRRRSIDEAMDVARRRQRRVA